MPELEVEGFPFILIDKVLGSAPGERAIGLRNVTANDPLLASPSGGVPARMRRSLLIEAFSQLASLTLAGKGEAVAHVEIARIDAMRFVRSPAPGDQLVLTVELAAGEGNGLRAACKAEAGGELVAEGTLELQQVRGT